MARDCRCKQGAQNDARLGHIVLLRRPDDGTWNRSDPARIEFAAPVRTVCEGRPDVRHSGGEAQRPIPDAVDYQYIWGDALDILNEIQPAARIVNLETSITKSDDFWPRKGIHYRMHPGNVELLKVAGDRLLRSVKQSHASIWAFGGLVKPSKPCAERASTSQEPEQRRRSGLTCDSRDHAGTRVLVFGYGMESAGVPASWAAGASSPGVNFLPDLSPRAAAAMIESIRTSKPSRGPRDFLRPLGRQLGIQRSGGTD